MLQNFFLCLKISCYFLRYQVPTNGQCGAVFRVLSAILIPHCGYIKKYRELNFLGIGHLYLTNSHYSFAVFISIFCCVAFSSEISTDVIPRNRALWHCDVLWCIMTHLPFWRVSGNWKSANMLPLKTLWWEFEMVHHRIGFILKVTSSA